MGPEGVFHLGGFEGWNGGKIFFAQAQDHRSRLGGNDRVRTEY